MIKILKHGSIYKELKETCHSCKCVFIFDEDYIKYNYDLRKHYVFCPECNNIIDIKL